MQPGAARSANAHAAAHPIGAGRWRRRRAAVLAWRSCRSSWSGAWLVLVLRVKRLSVAAGAALDAFAGGRTSIATSVDVRLSLYRHLHHAKTGITSWQFLRRGALLAGGRASADECIPGRGALRCGSEGQASSASDRLDLGPLARRRWCAVFVLYGPAGAGRAVRRSRRPRPPAGLAPGPGANDSSLIKQSHYRATAYRRNRTSGSSSLSRAFDLQ